MECVESLRVQAYFDGELDPASTAAIERHLEACAGCRCVLRDLEEVRALLRDKIAPVAVPIEVRARIMASLDQESSATTPPWGRQSPSLRRSRPFSVSVAHGA